MQDLEREPSRRLSFEGAVYRVDVDDMQFFEFFVGPFGLLRVGVEFTYRF